MREISLRGTGTMPGHRQRHTRGIKVITGLVRYITLTLFSVLLETGGPKHHEMRVIKENAPVIRASNASSDWQGYTTAGLSLAVSWAPCTTNNDGAGCFRRTDQDVNHLPDICPVLNVCWKLAVLTFLTHKLIFTGVVSHADVVCVEHLRLQGRPS